MMLVLRAEWSRFICNRVNLLILALAFLLLCCSAVWSGLAAERYRTEAAATLDRWTERLQHAQRKASAGSAGDPVAAARSAFEFARRDAPPALRPALGGLALSVQQFTVLPADIRVSVDGRHLDGRKSDPFDNPLLQRMGMPDFAAIAALLLPIVIIGLCYGLVQEGREQGIWRLICAQTARPWQVLAAGLLVRHAAVSVMAALGSLPAFLLDSGATLSAFCWWVALLGLFCTTWIAIAGVFSILRISAAASALGMLAVWLFVTFAAPSVLMALAQARETGPSRLAAMIDIRVVQQKAEEREKTLLDDWYERHAAHRPQSVGSHSWPVSVVPRYIDQNNAIAPLMAAFDDARARQVNTVEPLTWLSPGLALVLAADKLAGADAARHASYVEEVDRFEKRWQHFFVPRIMSYRGLHAADFDTLPTFRNDRLSVGSGIAVLLFGFIASSLVLAALAVYFRRRLLHP